MNPSPEIVFLSIALPMLVLSTVVVVRGLLKAPDDSVSYHRGMAALGLVVILWIAAIVRVVRLVKTLLGM